MDATREDSDARLLLLHDEDNVFVLKEAVAAGETILVCAREVEVPYAIAMGHKIARQGIHKDGKIIKHGVPIGSATEDILVGAHVHLANLRSDYTPTYALAMDQDG